MGPVQLWVPEELEFQARLLLEGPVDDATRSPAEDAEDPSEEPGATLTAQRLEYCGALRAFFRPYFRRSFSRESRVRNPSAFMRPRRSGSSSIRARAMPWRSAPACPATPPPCRRATTSRSLLAAGDAQRGRDLHPVRRGRGTRPRASGRPG